MILNKIKTTADNYPDKIAVQIKAGDGYQQYSYRELLKRTSSAARALREEGVHKGDRIILVSENRPEWIIAYLSVVSLGAVIVPLDAQITEKELELLISSSEAKAVFVSSGTRNKLPRQQSFMILSFDSGEGLSFREMLTTYPDAELPPPPGAADLAALLYTSGTTGDPKAVMLSHGNLVSNASSLMKLEIIKPEDNMLCILPMHHTYPSMTCMLLPLGMGTTVTLLNSLKGPDITACMQETRVSVMVGVPQLFAGLRRAIFGQIRKKPVLIRSIISFLLTLNGLLKKTAGLDIGKYAFGKVHAMFGPAFRLFASGGARLEPDVYTDMTNLGFTMVEGYGLTETAPVCTFNPVARQKPGSIGIPLPGVEVKIANPDENGQGEIAVRGPNVMLGYYKKPEATAEVLKEGWFYTGDLGYRDRDGYFFISGRSREMIALSTGKKIFPDELEKFYKQILSIKEICLLQTERGLEAAIVPDFDYLRKMNLHNARETIATGLEDLSRDLPPYKRIIGFKIFKDALPATRLGKLKRSLVKDMYLKSVDKAVEKTSSASDNELLATEFGRKLVACLEPFSAKKNILPDDNLELDLGLDSLARVELVVSIEKTFNIFLPESFGSEIFTVRELALRVSDLAESGTIETGKQVRSSWTEILAQEPVDEFKRTLDLDSGRISLAGKYLIRSFLVLFFRIYNRLSVHGLDNLPQKGPFMIAPNHVSFVDAPAIMSALPWKLGSQTFFLGTSVYFGGPLTSHAAKIIQVIPVDMDTRLFSALQLSAYALRRGKILCVFPEGSRAWDGRIKEFKKGVGIVAGELNIPVIPTAIQGTYEMLARGKIFPRPAKVSVTFAKPIYPHDMDYEKIVKSLYDQVASML